MNKKLGRKIAKLLKGMCRGQGDARLYISWDSVTGDPVFQVIVNRERDGKMLHREDLSENEFILLINEIVASDQ